MQVPFLNLQLHHQPMRSELVAAFEQVLDSGAFAGGVGNGTDALWFALLALGVKPGDEVITVPSTFMATAEAISYCGATPVFVDIDEETFTMDPAKLAEAVTPWTR